MEELEDKLQPNDKNWKLVIVVFELSEKIEIPKFLLSSIAIEGEELEIWGYGKSTDGPREYDLRDIRGITNNSSNSNTPLGYNSSPIIEKEYIGSPILDKNGCIIGLHIQKNPNLEESSDYQGQLISNIQKTLKDSKNTQLNKIAENMKKCP